MARLQIPLASVGLSGLQPARISPVDSGGEALARGMAQVGAVAAGIAERERAETDKRVVLERTTVMRDKLNEAYTFAEGIRAGQVKDPAQYGGRPGQSLTGRFEEAAKELHKEFSSGLTARQLAEFDQSMLPTMTALKSGVMKHESQQWQVMEDTEAKAAHLKNANLTAAVGTAEAVEAGVAEAVRLAADDARRFGLDKTAAEMHQLASTSGVVGPTISRLLKNGRSEQAKVLFEQYRMLMLPQERERIQDDLDVSVIANRGRFLANTAASKFGEDLTAARSWIEAQAGDDDKLRAKADQEFLSLFQIARTQKQVQEQEAVGAAFDAAIQARNQGRVMTPSQIDSLIVETGVRGDHRITVGKQIEYLFRGDPQERAMAREARAEQRAVKLIEYLVNPEKVAALSEKQIYAMVPELGPENALSLARMKKQMQVQAGQLDIPGQVLSAVIKETGMDANKGGDAKKIAAAKLSAEQEILARQGQKGMPLDDVEKTKILKRHFRQEMVPGAVFGTNKTLYGAADLGDVVKALPKDVKAKVMKVAERAGRITIKDGQVEFVGSPAEFLAIRDDIEQFEGRKKGK